MLANNVEILNSIRELKSDCFVRSKLADATRKIAILKSNETMMVRRYRAVQDSESELRRNEAELKKQLTSMEHAVTAKLGELQRARDAAVFKVDSLQKTLLEDSVPASALETANKQLAEVTANYRYVAWILFTNY